MQFGRKVSGAQSFGQKVANYGSAFGKKFGDILRKVGNTGMTIGETVLPLSAGYGAEIIALSSLIKGAGAGATSIGNALEKRSNHHNRLM